MIISVREIGTSHFEVTYDNKPKSIVAIGGATFDELGEWLSTNTPAPEFTAEEIVENAKIKVVTMRQFRLALLQENLLTTVMDAISTGTDEVLKIEWEYATEVNRNWESLIALATSLGKTSTDIDNLFQLANTK